MFDAIWSYNNKEILETLNNLKLVKAKKTEEIRSALEFFGL